MHGSIWVIKGKVTRMEGAFPESVGKSLQHLGAFQRDGAWWCRDDQWPPIERLLHAEGIAVGTERVSSGKEAKFEISSTGEIAIYGFLPRRVPLEWLGRVRAKGYFGLSPWALDEALEAFKKDGITANLTAVGAREDAYVSRVRASQHVPGRAWVAKNGYRFDDFRPFLYRTDDWGATWRSLGRGLPDEPINVVFEDHRNPDLIFVGNDTGVFVSIDGGSTWVRMNNNMPNVPVHDLLVHPRDNDLVLGTYGRGFWITNIAPLQELNAAVLASDAHLFTIPPAVQRVRWQFGANDYLFGQRHLQTPNPPDGMIIRYYLKSAAPSPATVTIVNAEGQEMARLEGSGDVGINTVVWNARIRPPGAAGGRGGGPGRGGPAAVDYLAPLGDYTVTVNVAGRTLTQKARVAKTQGWTLGPTPVTIR